MYRRAVIAVAYVAICAIGVTWTVAAPPADPAAAAAGDAWTAASPAVAGFGGQGPELQPSAVVVTEPRSVPVISPTERPLTAFALLGLPLTRNVEVRTWEDLRGSIILTPDRTDGAEVLHEVYVEDIAYGLKGDTVALAYLRGLFDDGRIVDLDRTDRVTAVSGPAELVGHNLGWSCGSHAGPLRVEEIRYVVDAEGHLQIQTLRGKLNTGDRVAFERQAGQRAECDPQAVTECVENPSCWGFCQSIISCGCVGSGECDISVRIKCVNNDCLSPRYCYYNVDTGLCPCVHAGLACQTTTQELTPGSVACSNDGGFTVTENGHARMYVLSQPQTVVSVQYGVEFCRDATGQGYPCNVYLRLWHAPNFPQLAGALLLDNVQDLVPDGTQLELRTVQMSGQQVPPGPCVVEIWNSNGDTFFGVWPGSNASGQSAPSFIRTASCGLQNWTNLADIGFHDIHLVLCMQVATVAGDMNCDGVVSFPDINPFVLALANPAGYAAQYPHCFITNGDINANGNVGFEDINPFVECIVNGGCL